MKWLLLVMLSSLLWPSVAMAQTVDSGWMINRFSSYITIESTGLVKVDEVIEVNFDQAKHGIYRDLPLAYDQGNGQTTYSNIDVQSVTRNGNRTDFTLNRNSSNLEIKIGDPNQLLSGKQSYELVYSVKGVLQSFTSYDELNWNVTGNNWGVPMTQVLATVHLPQDGVVQQSCYQGVAGSNESCQTAVANQREVQATATRGLLAGEGLTVAVGYTHGMVPILIGTPPTWWEMVSDWMTSYLLAIVAFVATVVAGGAMVLGWWLKRGRDLKWAQPEMLATDQQAEIEPLIDHETVVVEFTPPDNLPPGMMGLLATESVSTVAITASIVNLAVRGFLTITEQPKTGIFGSTDYILTQVQPPSAELYRYEQLLLTKLFSGRSTVTVSALKDTFFQDLAEVKDQLAQDATDKGYFQTNPGKTKKLAAGIGSLLLFGGIFFGIYLESLLGTTLLGVGWGVGVVGLLLLLMSRFLSGRTAKGHELHRRIKGYRLFIATAEQYRQQFFEQQNLFNQVLPYAILFGLTKKLAKAMEVIGFQPANMGWYYGATAFNLSTFGNSMDTMSHQLSTTMASAPSQSGSGGGGFSGGGFGGGGGGSW